MRYAACLRAVLVSDPLPTLYQVRAVGVLVRSLLREQFPRESVITYLSHMSEVDAEALESAMSDVFPNVPPAELHGTLSGLICAGGNPGQGWMDALAMDEVADLDHQSRELLSELLNFVRGQLDSAELRFNLLLPDDDSALVQRTSALADWCRGYLYGLALGGISDQDELPPDCSEVITDVIQISRAEFEMGQPDERDEAAFLEVVEYVRVGVLLVFEELRRPGENESIH